VPDAYFGGLVLQQIPQHHVPLRDPLAESQPDKPSNDAKAWVVHDHPVEAPSSAIPARPTQPPTPQPEPVMITGTIQGRWGFDSYTGPTVQLQQLPGSDWRIVSAESAEKSPENPTSLITGHSAQLLLTSTGTACVHTITARPTGQSTDLTIPFKPETKPDQPRLLALTMPLEHEVTPGDLHLAIQQYDQPKADEVSTRTFSEPATITSIELHAGDKSLRLSGTRLNEIDKLSLGDLVFTPAPEASDDIQPTTPDAPSTLHFALAPNLPAPPTHVDDHLSAKVTLRDGRAITVLVTVSAARPTVILLGKSESPVPNSTILLGNTDDLPLKSVLTFTLKSPQSFPRNGQVEIETLDGTLRTVLTLAPSGGLLLQDPHTIVATLDPLRSFGPSAFGALHLRTVFPIVVRGHNSEASTQSTNSASAPDAPTSDWLPLATLVRLPEFNQLQCPSDATQSCTLTGSNFFLLQDISTAPDFSAPVAVPDGFTGTTLMLPRPAAGTIFLKLRDDPATVDSASLPVPAPPATHAHNANHAAKPLPATTPVPTQTQESPASSAPGPSASTSKS
jgi:hypothetical protein